MKYLLLINPIELVVITLFLGCIAIWSYILTRGATAVRTGLAPYTKYNKMPYQYSAAYQSWHRAHMAKLQK